MAIFQTFKLQARHRHQSLVHEINQARRQLREYHSLVHELRMDSAWFQVYFRLTVEHCGTIGLCSLRLGCISAKVDSVSTVSVAGRCIFCKNLNGGGRFWLRWLGLLFVKIWQVYTLCVADSSFITVSLICERIEVGISICHIVFFITLGKPNISNSTQWLQCQGSLLNN